MARPRKGVVPCVCPRAKQLLADKRRREREQKDAQRRAAGKVKVGTPEHKTQVALSQAKAVAASRKRDLSAAETREKLTPRIKVIPRRTDNIAACRNFDPELWFSGYDAEMSEALSICGSCPFGVKRECLEGAVRRGDRWFGIFGGLLPEERRNANRVQHELRLLRMLEDEV
jgi:hypothetical protein